MNQALQIKVRRRLALVAVGGLMAAGCGGDVGRVSGRVVRTSGEPLAGASVIARCEESGVSCYGTTGADGRFELSTGETGAGVPPGTYHVVILERKASRDAVTRPTIAAKFGDPAQSGLSFTVASGEHATLDVTVAPP
jgi:hypothetical protein